MSTMRQLSVRLILQVFTLLIFSFFALSLHAEDEVDINKVVNELQQLSTDPDAMRLVWWIPNEFWELSMGADPSVSPSDITDVTDLLGIYTVVAVVDGQMGAFGGVTYLPESKVRSSVSINFDNRIFSPFSSMAVSPDAKNLLDMMKPMFENMLGAMGKNMHFLLFEGLDDNGQRLIDPMKKGELTVELSGESFRFRLPLGSLLPQHTCSKCNEVCSGAYSFCPWCGTELTE